MPRVLKTPAADQDLFEIGTYIAKDNPVAADRLLVKINERLDLLANAPFIGAPREEFAPGLRSSPVGNYVVFYQPISNGIEVIRVLHGARNLRRIFRRRG